MINIFLGHHACIRRFLFDFLSVFVRSREEHDIVACLPREACHRVRRYRTVGMPDVQIITGIINGRRDVK